jgi:hypothetical protein
VYAPKRDTINQYNLAFLHYLFLVLLVLLVHSCSICLCCFEEKIIYVNLTRQGSIKFHTSYQVFVRTYFGDSAREDIHVLIVAPSFTK